MTFNPEMQRANLLTIEPDVHGRISKQSAELDGVAVTRVTFGVGARWSEDLKPYAGTALCELPHVSLVLSGVLRVVMAHGSVQDFGPNDVMLLRPVTTHGPLEMSHASLSNFRAVTTTIPAAVPVPTRHRIHDKTLLERDSKRS